MRLNDDPTVPCQPHEAIAAMHRWQALLAGCDMPERRIADQCLRRELFQQCLGAIPKGPERTVYNDWAEVVSECESAAYYQSLRSGGEIPKGC